MENILKIVNASSNTINSTLLQELISVGTDFESKVSTCSYKEQSVWLSLLTSKNA